MAERFSSLLSQIRTGDDLCYFCIHYTRKVTKIIPKKRGNYGKSIDKPGR
jgi:hypothetical protein